MTGMTGCRLNEWMDDDLGCKIPYGEGSDFGPTSVGDSIPFITFMHCFKQTFKLFICSCTMGIT